MGDGANLDYVKLLGILTSSPPLQKKAGFFLKLERQQMLHYANRAKNAEGPETVGKSPLHPRSSPIPLPGVTSVGRAHPSPALSTASFPVVSVVLH